MKAILKFDLPEERDELEYAMQGHIAFAVIEEMKEWLRQKAKYSNEETIGIEEVRNKLNDLIGDLY